MVVIACMFPPPNRGGLNSTHIHGTSVPVGEPSTASIADLRTATKSAASQQSAPAATYERHLRMSVWHDAARVDARAQGIAVQVGRDRDYRDRRRHDSDVTVSVG